MPRLRELASTYIVQKRSIDDEAVRFAAQDRMMTIGMGGVLPELADPTRLRSILDVGCGTGDWLRDTAKAYPTIERLVGVDISYKLVAHARTQAEKLGLGQRVQFETMDALGKLGFPESSFDLVNQRAGLSWLRTWDWPKVLMEYQRVSRPGGIIRVAEPSLVKESNSPALMKLNTIMLEAFYHAGYFFAKSEDGVTRELVDLLTRSGIENVQSSVYTLVHTPGNEAGEYFYQGMAHTLRMLLPFFQKWTRVPEDYQRIYKRALKEMREPGFMSSGTIVTAWGTRRG